MTALGFQDRFVPAIRAGLDTINRGVTPKLQTIRAGTIRSNEAFGPKGRLLARVGHDVALYARWRAPDCYLIGRGVCWQLQPVMIDVEVDLLVVAGYAVPQDKLDTFARNDGFKDWADMKQFFQQQHGTDALAGVLIQWRAA